MLPVPMCFPSLDSLSILRGIVYCGNFYGGRVLLPVRTLAVGIPG